LRFQTAFRHQPISQKNHRHGTDKTDGTVDKNAKGGFNLFFGMHRNIPGPQQIAANRAGQAVIVKKT